MKNWPNEIIIDTLKKKDPDTGKMRWSRTSLTMFSSFVISVLMAGLDFVIKDFFMFRFDVFLVFMSVATGVKVADAISAKLKQHKNDEQAHEN